MPDTTTSPDPQAATTTAPPPTTTPPSSPQGSDSFIAEMDAVINPPKTEPVTPPKTTTAPTTTVPPEGTKPEPTQTKTTTAPGVKEKDPVSLRKRLAEIETKYSQLEQTHANEKRMAQEKIAEFEKRKHLTPEQEKAYADNERRLKELEAELYARDYKESPEFKEKYEQRWQRAFTSAVEEIAGMQITDAEGNTRTATQADFQRVLSAPKGQQWQVAKQLFGDEAGIVIQHRNLLKQIEGEATDVLTKQRQTYEQQKQERQLAHQNVSQEFERAHTAIQDTLSQKYPAFFGKDETDPAANEAFDKGRSFVDDTLRVANSLPIPERAARTAIIRNWAMAFPRMVHLYNKLTAQVAEKDKLIAQLQGSDPGAGGEAGGAAAAETNAKGVDDLVKEFDVAP